MTITKQGQPPTQRIWKGVCHSCKSEAEAFESELNVQHDQRDGDFAWMICPVCDAGNGIWDGMLFHRKELN